MILYSGHEEEDAHHTEGVAPIVSHEAHDALINWEAAGPRITYASFKQRKKTSSSTSFSATHPQTTRIWKQKRTSTTNCRHCVTNGRRRT